MFARVLIVTGATLAISSFFLILTGPAIIRLSHTVNVEPARASSPTSLSDRDEPFAGLGPDFLLDEESPLPPTVVAFLDEEPVDTDAGTHRLRLSQEASRLDMSIENSYTRLSPIQTGHLAYPWRYVAEPNRPTTLSVVEGREDAWYKWVVDGHTHGYGVAVDVLWNAVGWKHAVLIEKVNGTATCVLAAKVMVKYVRREIRSLSDRDRETFFQAAMIMQRVPTEVGLRLYGSKYRSKDYYNRIHLYYGGTADCDHWHQGAGFVTSHMAFTLQYEQSLQAIYPEVSVPYWDFTLESTFYDPTTWRSSLVFADDWFGNASPDNELHTVTAGRWAFVPTMTRSSLFSDVHNSYGLLRAPWNNDPTPFLTRHNEIYGYVNNIKPSGCKEYSVAIKKSNWMSMSRQLNSAAHGHIHETVRLSVRRRPERSHQVGGSWNHHFAQDNTADPAILTFAHEIQALSKELWRGGYVVCPEVCSMDTPWRECQCQCTPESLGDEASYEILDASGVLSAVHYYDHDHHQIQQWLDDNGTVYYTLPGYTVEESHHLYDELLKALCSPGHIGDMFQATSTNDITFWVLHPSVDRLWHYKRLGNLAKYDETWDPYHECYGHNPTDFQPFSNLFDSRDTFYTNAEIYDSLRPNSAALPYMYDNFRWPHCELIGYSISNES